MTSFGLNSLLRTLSANTVTRGFRASTDKFYINFEWT